MQLAILTAVLAAIAAAEGGGGPVAGLSWRLLAIASATLVAPLTALVAAQRLALRLPTSDDSVAEHQTVAATKLQSLAIVLWLAGVGVILLVGQWPRIVRANWQLEGWPLVDEVAILLPVVAPLFFIWAALYRLERSAQLTDCAAQKIEPPRSRLLEYVALQARHHLALILLPPLIIVGLIEAVAATKITSQFGLAWWFVVPQVAVVFVLMPLAVRRMWRTRPLVGQPLRQMLDDVCHARRCQLREILVWQTNGTMANAAVVGMSGWLRYLLLTDVLLCHLTDAQIAAVVRHELGHLRRWHLPLRLAMLLLPVAWWLAIKQAFPGIEGALNAALTKIGFVVGNPAALVLPLGLLLYTAIAVGWYSRLLEHDADLDACLNARGQFDLTQATDFCTALNLLCGDGNESRFGQWLHPASSARIELLYSMAAEPRRAVGFRCYTTAVAVLIGLLYAGAAAFVLLVPASSF